MYNYLIVDDEPMIRYSIRYMLETSGLLIESIQEADNGISALKVLEENPVDYVLIDINMPKMNGLDLSKEIFNRYHNITMCIISGYDDFEYAQKAIRYGVRAYLLKPVNAIELKHALLDLMEERKSKSASWIKHKDFNHYVEQIFDFLQKKEIEQVMEQAHLFLKDIDQLNDTNYWEVISDLTNQLSNRISHDDASFHLLPFSECIIKTRQKQQEWFICNLNHMMDHMNMLYRSSGNRIVEIAKRMMEKEDGWNITLEEISSSLGINASYFSRIFREETGKTFVTYRTELRMKRAGELMNIPELSVSAISFEVGYNDVTHFIRVFKKYMGMSPSDYRKQSKL